MCFDTDSDDYCIVPLLFDTRYLYFLQDCNNDGVTDCEDYARLHFHGKDNCAKSLKNLNFGKRFETCKPVSSFPNGNFYKCNSHSHNFNLDATLQSNQKGTHF